MVKFRLLSTRCLLLVGSAGVVEDALTKFFNKLTLDLQGAELSFMSLAVTSGPG